MKTIYHPANTRGRANHGWLDSSHTFSFANYFDAQRMHFGALRVLNDDFVEGGMGFGKHPHDNMEIISIPLTGDLEHKASMGNTTVIKQNDVQIMSAGSGVQHSEYNKNKEEKVNFLQLWIFPKVKNIQPSYDQKTFNPTERINKWQEIVSPESNGNGVVINQDAWLHLGNFDKGFTAEYEVKQKGNGVYVFVLDGDVMVGNEKLSKRDGLGIWDAEMFSFTAESKAELLLIEVPMNLN